MTNNTLYADAMVIYPGIYVKYHHFECNHIDLHHESLKNVMEINHCHYGRVGWNLKSGQSIYMGEGDTTFHSSVLCCDSSMDFPLGFYQGLTIIIDFDRIIQNPPELLNDASIDYEELKKQYCRTDNSIIVNSGSYIDYIIHELYHIPENLQKSYLKIKTIELILYLSRNPSLTTQTTLYNSEIIATIREIHDFITEHLDKRYTIDELSSKYLINTSTLKEAFKAVYGMPIATYMKEYRIRQAAKLLQHTSDSIASIGLQVGYKTSNEFTKAFKEVLGCLPSEYRI